ncbi:hypothetical protein BJ741DRAFT_111883 [Chytriomyces cf. hyalinus JEL632]|nr:hypothetical protein BJ741DRAFT_111883 [Chytriomyces cf. hyalinus JEL632]
MWGRAWRASLFHCLLLFSFVVSFCELRECLECPVFFLLFLFIVLTTNACEAVAHLNAVHLNATRVVCVGSDKGKKQSERKRTRESSPRIRQRDTDERTRGSKQHASHNSQLGHGRSNTHSCENSFKLHPLPCAHIRSVLLHTDNIPLSNGHSDKPTFTSAASRRPAPISSRLCFTYHTSHRSKHIFIINAHSPRISIAYARQQHKTVTTKSPEAIHEKESVIF